MTNPEKRPSWKVIAAIAVLALVALGLVAHVASGGMAHHGEQKQGRGGP